MVNDAAVARDAYIGQKAQFTYPNDERMGIKIINEFFQPAEFLKRLELHREHICKSKTKKQQALKLYYIEIPQKERQIHLIDFVPDQKNGDGMAVIQRDIDEKREVEEQKEKKRQEKLLAQQQKSKLNKQRINELAKPNDKWKVGKKLLEL